MFSTRGKAEAAYKKGMAKANARDHEGAITDYTAVIEMKNCPADLRAMAFLNRALSHSGLRDYTKAQKDLDVVLALPGAPEKVIEAARDKIKRMKRLMEEQAAQEAADSEFHWLGVRKSVMPVVDPHSSRTGWSLRCVMW